MQLSNGLFKTEFGDIIKASDISAVKLHPYRPANDDNWVSVYLHGGAEIVICEDTDRESATAIRDKVGRFMQIVN